MALDFFSKINNLFDGWGQSQNQNNGNLFEPQGQAPETNWKDKFASISKDMGRTGALIGSMDTVYGRNFLPALNQYQHDDRIDVAREAQNLKTEARNDTDKMRNVEYLVNQGISRDKAVDLVFNSKASTVVNVGNGQSEYEKAYGRTLGNKTADAEIKAKEDKEAIERMRPTVENALLRGEEALEDGSGLGIINGALTGMGFGRGKSGENYANIQTANSQMNIFLRQKLQASGLTGSELNSALEAEAYRYTIHPTDSPSIIEQKIKNFKRDYLGTGDASQDPLGLR